MEEEILVNRMCSNPPERKVVQAVEGLENDLGIGIKITW